MAAGHAGPSPPLSSGLVLRAVRPSPHAPGGIRRVAKANGLSRRLWLSLITQIWTAVYGFTMVACRASGDFAAIR